MEQAEHQKARKAAFHLLDAVEMPNISNTVWAMLAGLRSLLQMQEENPMNDIVITPEYMQALGEEMRRMLTRSLTPEERLAGLAPEERLAGLALEERLIDIDPKLIEAYLRQRMGTNSSDQSSQKPKQHKPH